MKTRSNILPPSCRHLAAIARTGTLWVGCAVLAGSAEAVGVMRKGIRLLLLGMVFAVSALTAGAVDGVVDVTAIVKEAVKDNGLAITASNGNFTDPQPGGAKRLTVEYQLGNEACKKSVKENEVLEIKGSAERPLAIIKAGYGMELEVVDAKLRGADERTPSRSEYFTWINNYDNGPTEKQTLANLAFFKWLYDDYGMVLDIYAFDVGALDGGGLGLEKRLIPSYAVKGIAKTAAAMKTRLGVWTGADGYGNTPEHEAARREIFVSLCRDYNFALFKFDAYSIGGPRPEKLPSLAQTLKECRAITPDLICLNHRLQLGPAAPYMTTTLWEGAETYIDVHSSNATTAPHHRAGALSRDLPPFLTRLVEDHGVCISSCIDYWEDDLVLQAFNRNLLLAPQIYGNPWFLRDEELPLMARIFNLHRRHNKILVDGKVLSPETYGPHAVSRGDAHTRFVTLRNLSWTNDSRSVKCDASIGLVDNGKPVEIRRIHPTERVLATIKFGEELPVLVQSFRSCLLLISNEKISGVGLDGCDYQVVQDIPGKPVKVKLLGMPGTKAEKVKLLDGDRKFAHATLDGRATDSLVDGKEISVEFSGKQLKEAWQRKLGDLQPTVVPTDAEALYEATMFAADNNALEARSLVRSGPTKIPEVEAARKAFFEQKLFVRQGGWDHYLFDGDPDGNETSFLVRTEKYPASPINGGVFRIDLGRSEKIDKLVISTKSGSHTTSVEVSDDLITWAQAPFNKTDKSLEITPAAGKALRYVRVTPTLAQASEVTAFCNGKLLADRSAWRASNLFGPYAAAPAKFAWAGSFTLQEMAPKSYLAIAINGKHGVEGAYAAIRVNGRLVGAPDRAQSYLANCWEAQVGYTGGMSEKNYTYYIPLTTEMVGKQIDAVVLQMAGKETEQVKITPEVWIAAYPAPHVQRELVLW